MCTRPHLAHALRGAVVQFWESSRPASGSTSRALKLKKGCASLLTPRERGHGRPPHSIKPKTPLDGDEGTNTHDHRAAKSSKTRWPLAPSHYNFIKKEYPYVFIYFMLYIRIRISYPLPCCVRYLYPQWVTCKKPQHRRGKLVPDHHVFQVGEGGSGDQTTGRSRFNRKRNYEYL